MTPETNAVVLAIAKMIRLDVERERRERAAARARMALVGKGRKEAA